MCSDIDKYCAKTYNKLMKKIVKKRGFTLAEVLITLGIIGVVAAITIPVLEQNIQNKQFKEAAKAAYSKASQAVQLMKIDNGGSLAYYYSSSNKFKSDFMQYFKVTQDCLLVGCVPNSGASNMYKSLPLNKAGTEIMSNGQFITTDGMFWAIRNGASSGAWPNMIIITVDVNGYIKGPNVYGKDTFFFQLLNDTLFPMGANGTDSFPASTSCDKSTPNNYGGLGCMQNVMQGVDY